MNTASHELINKPSIVKDAIYGLLSAALIGLVASLTFIMAVMLLSSQAFASTNTNALNPAPQKHLTAPTERGYFYLKTPHVYKLEVVKRVEV